jgi:hypothetical protein
MRTVAGGTNDRGDDRGAFEVPGNDGARLRKDFSTRKLGYKCNSEARRFAAILAFSEETRLAALRAALLEGEESGEAMPFDFDAFLARKRETDAPGP